MVTTRTALTTVVAAPIAVGLLALTVGTAGADTVPDKNRVVDTDDGWQLSITKTAENLDRYPNLAATMFTREGFVALKAVADVNGAGRQPISAGSITWAIRSAARSTSRPG